MSSYTSSLPKSKTEPEPEPKSKTEPKPKQSSPPKSDQSSPPIPMARTDETLFVTCGNLESRSNNGPRKDALLDPPVLVPDPYGWMRDQTRTQVEVLDHLKTENCYTASTTAHLVSLREDIYAEMLASIRETEYSTPIRIGDWMYYTRTFEGSSYSVHCRAPFVSYSDLAVRSGVATDCSGAATAWSGAAEEPIFPGEQQMIDENVLAVGKEYFSIGHTTVSPSGSNLSYTVDCTGDERYTIRIIDLCSDAVPAVSTEEKKDAGIRIDNVCSHIEWGSTDQEMFYIKLDANHRPCRLYYHRLGQDPETDLLLFEEPNDEHWMGIQKSNDERYLFVTTGTNDQSEVRYIDLFVADFQSDVPRLIRVSPMREGVLYDVEHRNGIFYITTNVGGLMNKKLVWVPVGEDRQSEWTDFALTGDRSGSVELGATTDLSGSADLGGVPFDGTLPLDGVVPFSDHLVCCGREGGIPQIWVICFSDPTSNGIVRETVRATDMVRLDFPESAHDVSLLGGRYTDDRITVCYDSLITPARSISIGLSSVFGSVFCSVSAAENRTAETAETAPTAPTAPTASDDRIVIKQRTVVGYDPSDYSCDRILVRSRDGTTLIPLSLVWRKDLRTQIGVPQHVHMYGYGSYGISMECDFSIQRLPLLRRGIIYAIAHVRGGGELGRQWHESPNGGKYLCKKNTFDDFIDCARHLIDQKITTPKVLSCEGRSAGGLLIGASLNQQPDLFRAAILGVPFVDVVATMVDATIPLTAAEWTEWGNPNEGQYLQYMLSYDPIRNVVPGATYPAMLLIGGLHDPRVQYWEPAKFAAEVRRKASSESGPICLKIETSAGHFSSSDRYNYLREVAFDWAFLLDQIGLAGIR